MAIQSNKELLDALIAAAKLEGEYDFGRSEGYPFSERTAKESRENAAELERLSGEVLKRMEGC